MNKHTLRSLGIGFLASGILTAAFAIFVQGNVPVEGVQVDTLFGTSQSDEDVDQYREEMSSLLAERDSLESTRNNLNESITSLNEENSQLVSEVSSLQGGTESAQNQETDETTEDNNAEDQTTDEVTTEQTDDTTDPTETEETATTEEAQPESTGSFTVASGESSAEIAQRLEEEGYVDSAAEFQSLIDEWNLSTVMGAGDYELNTDMSIHDIASIITNGAYYYY